MRQIPSKLFWETLFCLCAGNYSYTCYKVLQQILFVFSPLSSLLWVSYCDLGHLWLKILESYRLEELLRTGATFLISLSLKGLC